MARDALDDTRRLAAAVCKAVGLDPRLTRSLNLILRADELAVVEAVCYAFEGGSELTRVFELTEWKEV